MGQFAYFDIQLGQPAWKGKRILDFGGNVGNLLSESSIDAEKYWCIDVSREAIEKGSLNIPEAHWLWYDRYNISFHPTGSRTAEIPDLGHRFDLILAYSVFTHTDMDETRLLAGRLLSRLEPDGVMAFTFIDPHYRSWERQGLSPREAYPGNNLEWRLDRLGVYRSRADLAALLERVKGARWFRLAGDGDLYVEDEPIPEPERYEGRQYHVFHMCDFIREQFSKAEILPPVNGEMQHCCVLRGGHVG